MVRICHMTSAHRSDDGRIFKKECVSLANAGYEVFLVARGESRLECGIEVRGVKTREGRLARMLLGARDVYKRALALDADIYHFHDPELLPYGVRLAQAGKGVIFDSHENYANQLLTKDYIPSFARPMISRLYRAYETCACAHFDGVIAPCRFAGESIFEGRAKRVALVGNGCLHHGDDEGEIPPDCPSGDAICCLGSLTHARGITHLVKAAYAAGVHLILCGPIAPDYLERLRAMPEFGAAAEYRGLLPQKELQDVMRECFAGAAVGLNMGQYMTADALPTKVAEYLVRGLPVILFDSPFNREFLHECDCGIAVNAEDVEELAAAISRLKGDGELRRDMARRGYEYALRNLTWAHDERILLDMYEDVLKSQGFVA